MLNTLRTIWFMFRTLLETLWCLVKYAAGVVR
jgi:hypothetical protein